MDSGKPESQISTSVSLIYVFVDVRHRLAYNLSIVNRSFLDKPEKFAHSFIIVVNLCEEIVTVHDRVTTKDDGILHQPYNPGDITQLL